MMTLEQASRFFDNNLFTNVYGTYFFYGQILPFTDSVRSGASTRRRIMEISNDVVIPNERTVTEQGGQVYIIAAANPDFYGGDRLRVKHPVLPVDLTFSIRTIAEVLLGAGGTEGVYASPSYIRRVVSEEQSIYTGGYGMYLSSYYSVPAGAVMTGSNGRYYRIRENSRIDDVGFSMAEAAELIDPLQVMDVQQKTGSVLDPATDEYVLPAVIADVDVLIERIDLNFQHEALGFVSLEPGDRAISFLKADVASIRVGDEVGDYSVKAVSEDTLFFTVHGRK